MANDQNFRVKNGLTVGAGAANISANATTISIGTATVNATVYSGTSNNATNLGGTSAAGYQTTAGLSANVLTLTANNANNLGGVAASGYQTTAGLSANVLTLTANNANNLGGVAASGYQTTAGLSANVATLTANNANNLGGVAAASYVNTSGAYTITNVHTHNSNVVMAGITTAVLIVGTAADGVVSNSTVVRTGNATVFTTINSTAFSGTANNASTVGGNTAATLRTYTDQQAGNAFSNAIANAASAAAGIYQTTAGLSANVLTLTANNANNLGGVAASAYVNTSGTYTITGIHTYNANVVMAGNATAVLILGTAADGVDANSTVISVGNATVFTTVNSTSFSGTANNATTVGGNTAATLRTYTDQQAGNAFSNAIANAASAAAALYVNTSGAYTITGVHTYNANVVMAGNTTAVLIVGNNSTSNIIANSTALTVQGTATVGSVIANSTVIKTGNATVNTTINATSFSGTANNANNLLGATWASPPDIGSTTPANGYFTSVNATGVVSSSANIIGVDLHATGDMYLDDAGACYLYATLTDGTTRTRLVGVNASNVVFVGSIEGGYSNATSPGVDEVRVHAPNAVGVTVYTNSNFHSMFTANGDLGVKTLNPAYRLDVTGDIRTTTQLLVGTGGSPTVVANSTGVYATQLGGVAAADYVNTSSNYTLSGNIALTGSNSTINGARIGYIDSPQRIITAANTLIANDAGQHLYYTGVGASIAVTVPNNASVSFRTGATINVINGGNTITVANGAGVTLRLAGTTTTGTRTLANNAIATLVKVATDTWYISGFGVT